MLQKFGLIHTLGNFQTKFMFFRKRKKKFLYQLKYLHSNFLSAYIYSISGRNAVDK